MLALHRSEYISFTLLIRTLIFITLILLTTSGYCDEYLDLYEGKDIEWHLTPNDLIKSWTSNVNVLWLGKFKHASVSQTPEGNTEVLWLFSHHSFVKIGPQALQEPFFVKKNSIGHFFFTATFSLTPKQVEKEVLNLYKEPYFIIISGKPVQIGKYNGKQTIQIEPQIYYMSDSFRINFVE